MTASVQGSNRSSEGVGGLQRVYKGATDQVRG